MDRQQINALITEELRKLGSYKPIKSYKSIPGNSQGGDGELAYYPTKKGIGLALKHDGVWGEAGFFEGDGNPRGSGAMSSIIYKPASGNQDFPGWGEIRRLEGLIEAIVARINALHAEDYEVSPQVLNFGNLDPAQDPSDLIPLTITMKNWMRRAVTVDVSVVADGGSDASTLYRVADDPSAPVWATTITDLALNPMSWSGGAPVAFLVRPNIDSMTDGDNPADLKIEFKIGTAVVFTETVDLEAVLGLAGNFSINPFKLLDIPATVGDLINETGDLEEYFQFTNSGDFSVSGTMTCHDHYIKANGDFTVGPWMSLFKASDRTAVNCVASSGSSVVIEQLTGPEIGNWYEFKCLKTHTSSDDNKPSTDSSEGNNEWWEFTTDHGAIDPGTPANWAGSTAYTGNPVITAAVNATDTTQDSVIQWTIPGGTNVKFYPVCLPVAEGIGQGGILNDNTLYISPGFASPYDDYKVLCNASAALAVIVTDAHDHNYGVVPVDAASNPLFHVTINNMVTTSNVSIRVEFDSDTPVNGHDFYGTDMGSPWTPAGNGYTITLGPRGTQDLACVDTIDAVFEFDPALAHSYLEAEYRIYAKLGDTAPPSGGSGAEWTAEYELSGTGVADGPLFEFQGAYEWEAVGDAHVKARLGVGNCEVDTEFDWEIKNVGSAEGDIYVYQEDDARGFHIEGGLLYTNDGTTLPTEVTRQGAGDIDYLDTAIPAGGKLIVNMKVDWSELDADGAVADTIIVYDTGTGGDRLCDLLITTFKAYGPTSGFAVNAFIRNVGDPTVPATPNRGSYADPIPTGWSDGPPAGGDTLWMTGATFIPSDTTGTGPTGSDWTTPIEVGTNDAGLYYIWSTGHTDFDTPPGAATNLPTGDPDNPSWVDIDTFWQATPETGATPSIWAALSRYSGGVWQAWEIFRILGESAVSPTWGSVETSGGANALAWSEDQDGNWTPVTMTTELDCTFYEAGLSVGHREILITNTAGALTVTNNNLTSSGDTINFSSTGSGTATLTVKFEHNDSGIFVNETVYAVSDGTGATIRYIKPTDGTAIHNGTGTLTLEARVIDGSGDTLLASGTIKLYNGDDFLLDYSVNPTKCQVGSNGYTAILDSGDINGDAVIYLSDGIPSANTVYDTVTVVDIVDGLVFLQWQDGSGNPVTSVDLGRIIKSNVNSEETSASLYIKNIGTQTAPAVTLAEHDPDGCFSCTYAGSQDIAAGATVGPYTVKFSSSGVGYPPSGVLEESYSAVFGFASFPSGDLAVSAKAGRYISIEGWDDEDPQLSFGQVNRGTSATFPVTIRNLFPSSQVVKIKLKIVDVAIGTDHAPLSFTTPAGTEHAINVLQTAWTEISAADSETWLLKFAPDFDETERSLTQFAASLEIWPWVDSAETEITADLHGQIAGDKFWCKPRHAEVNVGAWGHYQDGFHYVDFLNVSNDYHAFAPNIVGDKLGCELLSAASTLVSPGGHATVFFRMADPGAYLWEVFGFGAPGVLDMFSSGHSSWDGTPSITIEGNSGTLQCIITGQTTRDNPTEQHDVHSSLGALNIADHGSSPSNSWLLAWERRLLVAIFNNTASTINDQLSVSIGPWEELFCANDADPPFRVLPVDESWNTYKGVELVPSTQLATPQDWTGGCPLLRINSLPSKKASYFWIVPYINANCYANKNSAAGLINPNATVGSWVRCNSKTYLCRVGHTNKEPGVAAGWASYWWGGYADDAACPAWNSGTTYVGATNEAWVGMGSCGLVAADGESPAIKAPASGDIWTVGETRQITWTGTTENEKIRLVLKDSSGTVAVLIGAPGDVNEGQHSWLVTAPSGADDDYYFRLEKEDSTFIANSATFEIQT